ncbi:hypothetical protein E6C27_scaffold45541G00050 [Cucumis melo var. makuwa]|uniref:Uncharacterized protein n=1 Tax=Cucumis melo var. makuwa TaxID=1194695 RepID=A0A5A7TBN1_CUCMM|nr:hypothetical protein E6C27_scaffold45541G00050 [Cucumis melo var. makuwa]
MIPAEKTSQRKDQECHIFQEQDQLPINKSELPQLKLMELDLKKPFRGENEQTSNDSFLFLVIVEFVIKMDCPYAVNELILMLGLVASEFGNEISLPLR